MNRYEFEKYIRFYLNFELNQELSNYDEYKYPENPNVRFVKYIKEQAKDDDYLFSYPMSVFWNLTSACNFRCVHCLYNNSDYSSHNDLTHDELMSLADELIEIGVTYVVLSGGEIFVRPDTMDIIRKLKANNIAVRLLTNGSLLTDKYIDELAKIFNPYTDAISISLDAATHNTFEKIRQTDKFETIVSNIKKLTSKNIKISAVCTVNDINISEIVETYKLAKKLQVYNFIVGKVLSFNESHNSLLVKDEELFKLYYNLSQEEKSNKTKLTANFWSSVELLNIPEVRAIIEEKFYQDLIVKNSSVIEQRTCHNHDKLAIKSDGTMYLCEEAIVNDVAPLGNYRENSLIEIWENRWSNPLFQPRKLENMVCKDCKYNSLCNSGCLVRAYATAHKITATPCNIHS